MKKVFLLLFIVFSSCILANSVIESPAQAQDPLVRLDIEKMNLTAEQTLEMNVLSAIQNEEYATLRKYKLKEDVLEYERYRIRQAHIFKLRKLLTKEQMSEYMEVVDGGKYSRRAIENALVVELDLSEIERQELERVNKEYDVLSLDQDVRKKRENEYLKILGNEKFKLIQDKRRSKLSALSLEEPRLPLNVEASLKSLREKKEIERRIVKDSTKDEAEQQAELERVDENYTMLYYQVLEEYSAVKTKAKK